MKNYFIIHGSFGSNKENWFEWLENYLKNKNVEVFSFNYPTPQGQSFENWSKVLEKAKNKINTESVFICHSIAPIFVIKYCLNNNVKIGKLISVSGANNFFTGKKEFDEINKTMFTNNIESFKNFCQERICFYSENDPYISFDALQNFAKSINAKEIIFKNAGHFNSESGYNKFEEILSFL